jgi:DNA-binding CsgD family transcriptional regulator
MQPSQPQESLQAGRDAFERRAWQAAYEHLISADQHEKLEARDLERLALAADLTGNDDECIAFLERAHREYLSLGETERAVHCAFWLAMVWLLVKGEAAISSGWVARGKRLLEDTRADSVESGYLMILDGLMTLSEGDPAAAGEVFKAATEVGRRFKEADLLAFGRLGQGQSLIHLDQGTEGMRLLDEVMAAVTAGEISTLPVGIIYCAVLSCCQETFDLRRAQEWTSAFGRWCDEQPDIVTFHGQCLVHRAELLQMKGAWESALIEAQHASRLLSQPGNQSWAGSAFYQQGELYRLRGEVSKAEDAYRRASSFGRPPQPGLALLRLLQGRLSAAAAAISRELAEAQGTTVRSRLLQAHIEIMLAAGDPGSAGASAEELAALAAKHDVPFLKALAAQAIGEVALAEGEATTALAALREAWTLWRDLEAPFEMARVRVQIGLSCRVLGDEDGAILELEAARDKFQQVGATPDLERVSALLRASGRPGGTLSGREFEVLRLIASGKTNRLIARELVLSEKTVARHVSNILTKLSLPSRTAATAYAYEHRLV